MTRTWVTLLAAIVAGGCARTANPPATADRPAAEPSGLALHDFVRHPVIHESEVAVAAPRIVSLSPTATEIACALGLRLAIVGRTRYCDYPPEIAQVPSVGAATDVSVETLLALRPDLVLVSGTTRGQIERLSDLNLKWEPLPDTTLADIFSAIRRVGELTGRPRTAADLAGAVAAQLDEVAARFRGVPRRRALLAIGPMTTPASPPFVAGPGSFFDELIQRAGHENAVGVDGRAFGPLSFEAVIAADPDVIVELDPDCPAAHRADHAAARAAWAQLGDFSAIRNNTVFRLCGNQHHLPGPRVAETFAALCAAIGGASK